MDRISKADRSALMSRIRSVSGLELVAKPVAEALAGCSLRHQPAGIPGRPDYANKSRKKAVFVHGCFWHSHWHCHIPKSNRGFWKRKLARNVQRHREVSRELRSCGWSVLVLWECDVRASLKALFKPSTSHSRSPIRLAIEQSGSARHKELPAGGHGVLRDRSARAGGSSVQGDRSPVHSRPGEASHASS